MGQPLSYFTLPKLPYPESEGIVHAKRFVLTKPLWVEGWFVPIGTKVLLYQSENHGVCVLPEGVLDINGHPHARRLFLT